MLIDTSIIHPASIYLIKNNYLHIHTYKNKKNGSKYRKKISEAYRY